MRLTHIDTPTIHNTTTVTLKRSESLGLPPITLTIHALPPDFPDEQEREIPSPRPKATGFMTDKKGRLQKDEMDRPIKTYDDDEPEYVAAVQRVRQLQSIKLIVDALDPSEVEFTATKDGDAAVYYEACRKEMGAFGISIGDMLDLIKAATKTSGIDPDDLKVARADFFETES